MARKALKELRREAKDLTKVVSERDELRKETKQLRDELEKAKSSSGRTSTEGDNDDTSFLKLEVDRLQRELDLSKCNQSKTPTYRDFPKNPTDQEEEILLLQRMCAEKDSEMEFLRQEIEILQKRERNSVFTPFFKREVLRKHISTPACSYDDENQKDED
eukprot:5252769-Ditylum_brightwellii.AAC.1